jgi:hypothetical protein
VSRVRRVGRQRCGVKRRHCNALWRMGCPDTRFGAPQAVILAVEGYCAQGESAFAFPMARAEGSLALAGIRVGATL